MALKNTENFSNQFIGKQLTDIRLYNINTDYLLYEPNACIVIDGGVELHFGEEVLSIGWNETSELVDLAQTPLANFVDELVLLPIRTKEFNPEALLLNKSVKSLEIKWNWYQDVDHNLDTKGTLNYIPIQMNFTFEDNCTLQIAAVSYETKKNEIAYFYSDSENELLIAYNRQVDIKEI